MTRFILTAALAWIALHLPGCTFTAPDADYSPLWRSAHHNMTDESEVDIAVPFWARKTSPRFQGWTLRPLWTYRRDPVTNKADCDFLAPLGRYYRQGKRSHHRFWPLFFHTRLERHNGPDIDWMFLPFFFGGSDPEKGNYFAFFPIGGTIEDFLSYDSFSFVLWPIYQKVRKKVSTNEYRTSTSILLLIGWSEGGRIDESYHILPFYMKSVWKGKYRKYSVLWPFFHYQELGLDTKHPAKAYGFWPLFHIENADNYYRHGFIGPILFLGPLLQFAREVPDRWHGKPNTERRSYYHYDVPWPILRFKRSREYERTRIFPFYSYYRETTSTSTFTSRTYLTPIFWDRDTETLSFSKSEFYFVPLYTRIRKTYKARSGQDEYVHIWPFFYSDVTADGGAVFSCLNLMPLRRVRPFEPVDRILRPFWNLYRYERDPSGAERHKALFHLLSIYDDEREYRFSIPLLYNYLFTEDDGWRHNVLWKVFSIAGDGDGLKSLEVLFIPIYSS